jgi:catechol 2,3-dioxygenase-like lactoylglutathione lyase family enzyme/GNAT superfamily N-acetyltransferase
MELDLDRLAARRQELKGQYLREREDRPASSARGVHHVALLSADVETTIRFYQDVLEFPLTELFENRDYEGSTHFFFDIGHGNALAFFDLPGLDVGPYAEVLGGLHHLARVRRAGKRSAQLPHGLRLLGNTGRRVVDSSWHAPRMESVLRNPPVQASHRLRDLVVRTLHRDERYRLRLGRLDLDIDHADHPHQGWYPKVEARDRVRVRLGTVALRYPRAMCDNDRESCREIRAVRDDEFAEVLAIINAAAVVYRGVIPEDRWHEPYMSAEHLRSEIESGVRFFGCDADGELLGVMGIQDVDGAGTGTDIDVDGAPDVTLIRHAYVLPTVQRGGVGGQLLRSLLAQASRPVLIGTWADACWAIAFYEKYGFAVVSPAEKTRLLRTYWDIPERQVETSVVLAQR